ncbi:MAG: 4Fe-4S binding protein [Bacteroidetes bacterium]|nr:4Fe-4S binding protein [Bacteroidota bacterium]MBL6943943.1 4Fe-4S binding protein [Bacteroidales bacterium]
MNKKILYIILFVLLIWNAAIYAQQRFPKPDFESGYNYPEYQLTDPRNPAWEYIDVVVLIVVLALTTRFTLKTRSRKSILLISLFSLIYFGFFRVGCICSIGAIQNIALALFNDGYTLPLSVLLFFLIPILFTLAYGRQFCAGACPLGAIQELTGFYSVKLPRTAEVILSTVPYIYLALSILFAATNSHFIICKYDPFVGIFRLNGPATIMIFGILLLISGVFINRPYCRFLCPYGVILNWVSRFSNKHLTITPTTCINCRLCENSCPYNAIIPSDILQEKESMIKSRKKFILYLILLPAITLGGIFFTQMFSNDLAMVNQKVRLANELRMERENGIKAISIDAVTFKESGVTLDQLFAEEKVILTRTRKGAPWVGGFLGLSLGIALLLTTIKKRRDEYKPDQGSCYSCGRCFEYCPMHTEKY